MQRQEKHNTDAGQAMQDPTPLPDGAAVAEGLSDSQNKRSQVTPFLSAANWLRPDACLGKTNNGAYYSTWDNRRKGEQGSELKHRVDIVLNLA